MLHAVQQLLSCPLCRQPFHLSHNSLICANRHCFNCAKNGTIHFLSRPMRSAAYTAERFAHRQLVMQRGFYQHITNAVTATVQHFGATTVLDAGCGEGHSTLTIAQHTATTMLACDVSKQSIQLAAKLDRQKLVTWLVADLANLPIADHTMDCVLNIFSPANYQQFQRILKPNGWLIKVVPNAEHLCEIRHLAHKQLRHKHYHNDRMVAHFIANTQCHQQHRVQETFALTPETRAAWLAMTPLLAAVTDDTIDWSQLTHLTVSAIVLIGKPLC